MGSLGALPAQPKMHFVFGQDTSGPLEFSLVLHLSTTPWVMALMTSCPDSGGLLLDTRPTSFDLGHYLCSKGILNASLEALLGLSLAFLAGYYSSPLLITATGHQEGHLPPSGLPQPSDTRPSSGRSRRPSPGTLRRPYPLSKVELTLLLPQLRTRPRLPDQGLPGVLGDTLTLINWLSINYESAHLLLSRLGPPS